MQKRNQLEEQRRDAMLGSLLGDVIGGLTDPNSPLAEADAALSHADKVRGSGRALGVLGVPDGSGRAKVLERTCGYLQRVWLAATCRGV